MKKIIKIILFLLVLIIVFWGLIFFKGVNTFSAISSSDSLVSLKNDDRWDILILGHQPTGGLTDSIMVLSYEKDSKKAAIFSIPRDLWVDIPNHGKEKINYAYVAGQKNNSDGGGLKLAEEIVSNITGLDIDFAVAGDVEALKEIVDTLGGIEVEENRYFSLDFYGNYVTIRPGINNLSGSETLAYVGSRSTIGSDFGRMERQQKVLIAIKDKITSLGLLSRPDKIWDIFNSIKKHIETDIPLSQVKDLIGMVSSMEVDDIKTIVFDTSNYLYSTYSNGGAYILLPKAGNFLEIQTVCQDVFVEEENENENEEEGEE